MFELVDPDGAQQFLAAAPPENRRLGQRLYNRGQVQGLSADEPGMFYRATVLDGASQAIQIFYDDSGAWNGQCSCGNALCEHVGHRQASLSVCRRSDSSCSCPVIALR